MARNLEIHKLRLKQSCRVCGPICKENQLYFRDKHAHAKTLDKIFKIDIAGDSDIHPDMICVRCYNFTRELDKCKRDVRKIQTLIDKAAQISKFNFVIHVHNCNLCQAEPELLSDSPCHAPSVPPCSSSSITAQDSLKPSPFSYSILSTAESDNEKTPKPKPNQTFPETSPLLVTKTPQRKGRGTVRDIIIGTDPRSIPSSQFVDPDLAVTYKCSVCSIGNIARVPLTPVKSNKCLHFYCPLCIENWRSSEFVNSSSCPVPSCRKVFGDEKLLNPVGLIHQIQQSLSVHCVFIKNGCSSIIALGLYVEHIETCEFRRNRGRPPKKPIGLLPRGERRRLRLEPVRQDFFDVCAQREEEPGDVLCGLLHSFLNGSKILQNHVRDIWNSVTGADSKHDDANNQVDEEAQFGRFGLLYKNELLLSANDYKKAVRLQKYLFGTKMPDYSLVLSALAQNGRRPQKFRNGR